MPHAQPALNRSEAIASALAIAARRHGRQRRADGGPAPTLPTSEDVAAYLDAFDNPNRGADVIRRGVPTPPSDAWLRYGDTEIIPAPSRWGDAALSGLEGLANVATAFPPSMAAAGPAEYAIGALLKTPRAALGPLAKSAETVSPSLPTSGPLTQSALNVAQRYAGNSTRALPGLRQEVDALTEQARSLGLPVEARPDVLLSPAEEVNHLSFLRDTLGNRIARHQADLDAVNAGLPASSVPSIDGITPIRERNSIFDTINGNPYVQSIPGRQGFPTKAEQLRLASQYFDEGGRLADPGPWGRDMPSELQRILQDTYEAKSAPRGPAANLPDVPSIMTGYKSAAADAEAARREADQLRGFLNFRERQLKNLRSRGTPGGAGQ